MSLLLLTGLALCFAAAISDLWRGTIPNALTYPVIALSPLLHFGLALYSGEPWRAAFLQGALSLLGILACGVVPYFMWRKQAIGGGDVKLFAAIGGLLLPQCGFEAELYVFVCASLVAPAQLAYQGKLLRTVWNIGQQAVNLVRPAARRTPLAPAAMTWFRLGPCFVLGFLVELVLHWRAS